MLSKNQSVRRSSRLAVSSRLTVTPSPSRKRRRISVSATSSVESKVVPSSLSAPGHEYLAATETRSTEPELITPSRKEKKRIEEPNPAHFPRVSNDWKFGAHVSAAGGVENAIVNAAEIGANAFALFLKSQRRWTSSDISSNSVNLFKSRLRAFGYDPFHIIPHGNYLVNLASPDVEKREKSYKCFLDDLRRCELLGLSLYNFHPGSTVGLASKEECISLIASSLNRAHKETESVITVIENMAGAGNVIGSKFAEIASIIQQVENKTRVGVCLDTCHALAAGYDLTTREGYEATLSEFDSIVGLRYLRAMHLNDSKAPLGSNKDRHENIGLGHLSLNTFAFIAKDIRLRGIPLILETPRSSTLDPNGDSPAVWRTEIEILNKLSAMGRDELAGGCLAESERREMTRVLEAATGRTAAMTSGGKSVEGARKSKREGEKSSGARVDGKKVRKRLE